ncbi:hypothetical protein MOMUL_29720 [Moorella mulderi DSM 14980]|uniref:ATP-binding protein n=1 Tax=Moorella mulderi DSM 14980 TaxID=1122241 RepID=A0A151ASY9_9FIRM|nr:hypothetical protein MOMUL_29720 [Moorella mulderi DSM 14980]
MIILTHKTNGDGFMPYPLDWSKLDEDTFEELCCQLARACMSGRKGRFFRLEGRGGDGGVEAYFLFPDGSKWGWQAKFFPHRLKDTNWRQIRKSIETALSIHPELVVYFVCLPIDLTSRTGRQGKSELEKWQELVDEYADRLSIELWGASYLLDLLTHQENAGKRAFFFGEIELSGEWFDNKLSEARESLSDRYTPDAHVALPELAHQFEILGRTPAFKKELLEWANRIKQHIERYGWIRKTAREVGLAEQHDALVERLEEIIELLRRGATAEPNAILPIEQIRQKVHEIYESTWQFYTGAQGRGTSEGVESKEKAYLSHIMEIKRLLYKLRNTIKEEKWFLANEAGLALYGEAGIGKSHCLFDIAADRYQRGLLSLFVLGHQFPTSTQPVADLTVLLGLGPRPEDEVLGALSAAAEASHAPLLIFIDALNESERKGYWAAHLPHLVAKLRRYPWLRLVISYRTSYRGEILGEAKSPPLPEIRHPGFGGQELEALSTMCKFYGIEYPSLPVFNPEFQNPLFLHLVLRSLRDQEVQVWPRGLHGFKVAYDLFISNANARIARRLDCDRQNNWASRAVQELARRMSGAGREWLALEEAKACLDQLFPERSTRASLDRSLYRALIDEHVIVQDKMWEPKSGWVEGVRFTFQRFADHALAEELIKVLGDTPTESDLQAAFGRGGLLEPRRLSPSVFQALAIQVPERFGKELIDYVDWENEYVRYVAGEAFLHSLVWRSPDKLPPLDELRNYLNEKFGGLTDETLEVILTVCARLEHPLNAGFLHQVLMRFPMAERDAFWTLYLHRVLDEPSSALRRLLYWGEAGPLERADRDSLVLLATAICWFLTSSNRWLRDEATKSLACIFLNRPECILPLLERFQNVDDLYVKERLYGAVYGASLWMRNRVELLKKLAVWFYEHEFNKGAPILHLTARDYARSIVEVAARFGALPEGIDLNKVRPPYLSPWPLEQVSSLTDCDSEKLGPGLRAISFSLSYKFGDFARYIVADVDKFVDRANGEPCIDFEQALRWIYNRILQLGYTDVLFAEHDNPRYRYWDRFDHKHERIGKKYQWIAWQECLARLSDHCLLKPKWGETKPRTYEGPWQIVGARNIDPSCLIMHQQTPHFPWPIRDMYPLPKATVEQYRQWVMNSADLSDFEQRLCNELLRLKDQDGQEWIVLYANYTWFTEREPGEERTRPPWRELYFQVRGYIVADPKAILRWSRSQDFWDHWMPEWDGLEAYGAYLGEYPWHFSWTDVRERARWTRPEKTGAKTRYGFLVPYATYAWGSGYDYSKEASLRLLLPAPWLVEEVGLHLDPSDLKWKTEKGLVVAFDPSSGKPDVPNALLLNASWMAEYLTKKNLGIFWAVAGEKFFTTSGYGATAANRLSGGFIWTGTDIKGRLRSIEIYTQD